MDYTLVIVYANGETASHGCSTLADVHNWIASSLRSQSLSDLPAKQVAFHVMFNHKGE